MSRGAFLAAVALLVVVSGAGDAKAGVIDLTTAGSSGAANGGLFFQSDPQPTGTGFIDPFVRIHATGTERGYNTDGQEEFDTKEFGGHNWTHSIKVSDVGLKTINGTAYREFLLDINEVASKEGRLLTLDEVEIYLADTGDLTGYPALGTKIYDLDVGPDGDSRVELDYKLESGSGSGDMFMYVPDELFGTADKFVYLYSAFGNPNPSDDGFEEWATREGVPPIPEPTTIVLFGVGVAAAALMRRRRLSS